ncbi:MAG TPA: hypothetical protein VNQ76_14070 [Planctomicrobium sp.]|nr:hypothetical protein [Planctomicrobium sp.]
MNFHRRIIHHGTEPGGVPQLLSLSAVRSCWFELHRQGGCGSGQLVLSDRFQQRNAVQIGDWISFEVGQGDRWYLGRIEELRAEVPAGIRLRLEGMSVELNQMFPGGFGDDADGDKPHLYAATDLFGFDPDNVFQTMDHVLSADDVVRLLMTQSLPATSRIQYVPERIEEPEQSAPVVSMKVRGEESARALLKDLAIRARGASWGVDEQGEFFFLRPRSDVLATYQEQQNLTSLSETRDMEFVFNRILLTGDYVYDQFQDSGDLARRSYRWRANFLEPDSRSRFGDRRIRIWLPWIRTQNDGLAFAKEFFRTYSKPGRRYLMETVGQTTLPRPWLGRVRVNDQSGNHLITAAVETIRVLFDHIPRFRMELGPTDPRQLWPEPPHDERWELPHRMLSDGGDVSLSSSSSSSPDDGDNNSHGGGGGSSSGMGGISGPGSSDGSFPNSDESSDLSSDESSHDSSDASWWSSDSWWDSTFDSSDDDSSLESDKSGSNESETFSESEPSSSQTGSSSVLSSHWSTGENETSSQNSHDSSENEDSATESSGHTSHPSSDDEESEEESDDGNSDSGDEETSSSPANDSSGNSGGSSGGPSGGHSGGGEPGTSLSEEDNETTFVWEH